MFPLQPAPLLIDRPIPVAMTDFWHAPTPEAQAHNELLIYLRARFDLRPIQSGETPELLLYSRMKGSKCQRAYDCPKVFYSGECDRARPRQADLCLTFDPDGSGNIRLPFWRLRPQALAQLFSPWDVDDEIAGKTDFCNFVYSNRKAPNRIDFFHRLRHYKKVNSAGGVENNIGGRLGGGPGEKMAFLRRHKFTIAFENQSHPGYTTEKMTEALAARTVPIYWGDPLAARDFNPKAFINAHDFDSLDALVAYVREVDQDPALYRTHLNAVATEPINGGLDAIAALDHRVFTALKNLIEHPPAPRASQRWQNRLQRTLWNLTHPRK